MTGKSKFDYAECMKSTILKLFSLLLIVAILPAALILVQNQQDIRQQADLDEAASITLSPASATFVPRQVGRVEVLLDTQYQQVSKVQVGIDITGTVPSDLKFAPTQPTGWLVTTNTINSTQAGLRVTLVLEPNPNQDGTAFMTTDAAASIGTFTFTGGATQGMNFIFDRNFTQVWQAQTGKNIVIPPIDYHYEFNQNTSLNPASLVLVKSAGVVPSKNNTFQVDLRANTGGQQVSQVKAVLSFDPRYLRIREVQKSEAVFPEYPDLTFDNQKGVAIITAQTPAAEKGTIGENILVAKVTFQALEETGNTQIALQYDPQQDSSSRILLTSSGGAGNTRSILGRVTSVSTAIDPAMAPVLAFGAQQISLWQIVGGGFLIVLSILGIGVILGHRKKTEYQHFPTKP